MEFQFALDWFSKFKCFFFGFMITIFFVAEEFVVFVLIAHVEFKNICSINITWLVNIFSIVFFCDIIVLLLFLVALSPGKCG